MADPRFGMKPRRNVRRWIYRELLLVILGLVLAAIAAFVVYRGMLAGVGEVLK